MATRWWSASLWNPCSSTRPRIRQPPRTLEQDCAAPRGRRCGPGLTPTPEIDVSPGSPARPSSRCPASSLLEGRCVRGIFAGQHSRHQVVQSGTPERGLFWPVVITSSLALIRKMVADMAMPGRDRGRTDRAGRRRVGPLLAQRLSDRCRTGIIAPSCARTMNWIAEQIEANSHLLWWLQASQGPDNAGFRTDAIDTVDADTLNSPAARASGLVILMAAYLGKACLTGQRVVPFRAETRRPRCPRRLTASPSSSPSRARSRPLFQRPARARTRHPA